MASAAWPLAFLSGRVVQGAGPWGRLFCDCTAPLTSFSDQQPATWLQSSYSLWPSTWGERDAEQGQGRDLGDYWGPFALEGGNSPRALSEPFGLTAQ